MSITRITSNDIEDTFVQGSFAPDPATTTATLWGHEAGYVAGTADVELIAAGTVAYSEPSYIYIDRDKAVPTIESIPIGGDVTAIDGILLAQVNSPTDFIDYRSWSSSSFEGLILPGQTQWGPGQTTRDAFSSGSFPMQVNSNTSRHDRIYVLVFQFRDPLTQIVRINAKGGSGGEPNYYTPEQRAFVKGATSSFAYEIWFFRDEDLSVLMDDGNYTGTFTADVELNQTDDFSSMTWFNMDGPGPLVTGDDLINVFNIATTHGDWDGVGEYTGAVAGNKAGASYVTSILMMKGLAGSGNLLTTSTRAPYFDWAPNIAFNTGPTQADNIVIRQVTMPTNQSDPGFVPQTFTLTGTPGSGTYALVDFQIAWDFVA